MPKQGLEQKIIDALEPLAAERGIDVVDVEVVGASKAPCVRVRIDHADEDAPTISLDEVTAETAWISDALDELDPIPSSFTLEVSSPGIDRPLRKRVDFTSECVSRLGLEGIESLCLRAEEAPLEMRESYDIATSRAVARLNLLLELALPFVRTGGVFLAMKGPDCGEEVAGAANAAGQLGGRIREVRRYTIPGTDVSHAVVIVDKLSPTPPQFPRRWARMQKKPL